MKYKRSPKYKGKRSIPLRAPITIQWFKWGTEEGKLNGKRPVPSAGCSVEAFTPSGRDFNNSLNRGLATKNIEPTKKIIIKLQETNQRLTLFYNDTHCWFVHEINHVQIKYISRTYGDRRQALELFKSGHIMWLRREPLD